MQSSILPTMSINEQHRHSKKIQNLDYPSEQKEGTVVNQILSMLQSVPSIASYALDFQRVSFTYVSITTDLKSILERSLVNLSNISMTMVLTFVKICVFTFWKIICHFQRHLVSFMKITGF